MGLGLSVRLRRDWRRDRLRWRIQIDKIERNGNLGGRLDLSQQWQIPAGNSDRSGGMNAQRQHQIARQPAVVLSGQTRSMGFNQTHRVSYSLLALQKNASGFDYDEICNAVIRTAFTNRYGYFDIRLGFIAVGLYLFNCPGDLGS